MRAIFGRRPSPAMIVALIALVVALGGTSYAALNLPKNSVGTKQLKKNAVTAAKIKKNAITGTKVKTGSLTGADIDLAKLGTVPSAAHAATASVASALAPLEPTHLIGAPGEPGFEDGSSNFGSQEGIGTAPAGFYKDHEGIVHLQGFVKVGSAEGPDVIFSLPPGFRPAPNTILYFNAFCLGQTGICSLDSGGDAMQSAPLNVSGPFTNLGGESLNGAVTTLPGTLVSLDGITFRAES